MRHSVRYDIVRPFLECSGVDFHLLRDSEDNEYIDGIEVVGRGEGPNGDDEVEHVEIHEGLTAEDISGKTAAAEAERELEADPELLDADAEDAGAADADAADADADGEDAGAADAGEADGEPEPEGRWAKKSVRMD